MMNTKAWRLGVVTLLVGGALAGGLLLGGSLVSAQTADETPTAEETETETVPADASTPSSSETPAGDGQTPDAEGDEGGSPSDGREKAGGCNKDRQGDGTGPTDSGTSFRGRGNVQVQ